MLDAQTARTNLAAVRLQEIDLGEPQNYRPVRLNGQWSERFFLLENQIRQGRPGYEVIGIFESGDLDVLVNRGWVPASYDRQQLPEITFTRGSVELSGYMYRSTKKPFTLGDPVWTQNWPERIQAVEWDVLQTRLDQDIYPYLVRLDAASEGALTTGWIIVNLPPEKHIAYAVQWAALAIALVLLTVFASSNLGPWIKYRLRRNHD